MDAKVLLAFLIIGVMLGSGAVYAADQLRHVARITITKPESIDIDFRWSDRDLDQDQYIPEVTRLNALDLSGKSVTMQCLVTNNGSSDITLAWSTANLPSGMSVTLQVDGQPWETAYTLQRGAQKTMSLIIEDDGTLAIGSHIFDLIFASI